MTSKPKVQTLNPGTYRVLGFTEGYFLSEHDEPLPCRVKAGRVVVPETAEFHGNPGCRFVSIPRETKRDSIEPSLIDPDMPRPLSPEQAVMRQMQLRMAHMEIAMRKRDVVTPRQIEQAIEESEPVVQDESEPMAPSKGKENEAQAE